MRSPAIQSSAASELSPTRIHPNGRFVYGANRAEATTEFQGKQVFKGGENSIVVYTIDQSTGEPTPIQHIETQKVHPRTFQIVRAGACWLRNITYRSMCGRAMR